jgi:hypothetical protein
MPELGVILAPSDGYVELAAQGARRFAKHILSVGEVFAHPKTGAPLEVDETWWTDLERNWNDKVVPIVGFPLANAKNEHDESPERNAGRVVGLRREGRKIIADIEVPDPDIAAKIGSTILGASAMLHLDYPDSGGRRRGKALCHVAATNRPHLTSLDDFAELEQVAATAEAGYTELPDGSALAPQVLMLCASDPDVLPPVMLADPEPDYQPEPDYYGGPAMTQEDIWRDEIGRLGLEAMRVSTPGRGSKPEYGMIVTDHDRRQAALSAEREISDEDILEATAELAVAHQVSADAVHAMAHDAHQRSGLGRSEIERARVLGEVQVALSRGRLEVSDEQVLALTQLYGGEEEVLRLTAEPELGDMFSLAHPSKSGRLVTTRTRAHSEDEDPRDHAQSARGGDMHAEVARYLAMREAEWGGESRKKATGPENTRTRPRSPGAARG